nr:unnamed protein product [Callosobruchus chinensis]
MGSHCWKMVGALRHETCTSCARMASE